MFDLSYVFGLGLQALHLLPPLVGLLLVLGIRATGLWRTWALLAFGLGLASGMASFGLTLLLYSGGYDVLGPSVHGLVQGLLNLGSLAAAGFGVAAVVADRKGRASDPDPSTDAAPGVARPYPRA